MANIQHKNLGPVNGDTNTGSHTIHHWVFTTYADMLAGTDVNFGAVTFLAADIGKVARVTSGPEAGFYILVDQTNPTFTFLGSVATDVLAVLAANEDPVFFNNVLLSGVAFPQTGRDAANKDYVDFQPPKTVSAATYTVLQSDNKRVIQFTNAAGCVVTVPHGLLSGTEVTLYALTGVVQFVSGGAGVASPVIPASLSASTQEARAVAALQICAVTSSYILGGDLNPSGPDPITDADFSSNGRMVRNGAGNYNVILDQLSGTTDPFSGSDFNVGYRVGSFWINQLSRSVYMNVDDTPASASWRKLDRVSDAEYDLYIGQSKKYLLFFRDEFTTDLDLWGSTLNGAGSAISILNSPTHGVLNVAPGTTFTGSSVVRIPTNYLVTNAGTGLDYISFETIAYIPGSPPDPAQDYYVRLCGFLNSSFNTDGLCFMAASGNYGVDNYWTMTRYNSSVTSSVNTTVLALTNSVNRFRIDYFMQKLTASFFINDVYQGQFTGSQITVVASGYLCPGIVNKITGTTTRNLYIDYTMAYGAFTGSRN